MIGFDPASHIFIPDGINRQTAVLDQVATVLVTAQPGRSSAQSVQGASSRSTIAK